MIEVLRLNLLGELTIQIGDDAPLAFASRRAEVMLAYLAVTGRSHPRETLATLLWDNRSQEQAMANLRSLLAQLPKIVKEYLVISRKTIGINEEKPIWLDTAVFARQLAAAGSDWQLSETARAVAAALKLYRGDFLEGIFVRESRGLEEWTFATREQFQHLAVEARQALATYCLHRRQYAAGIRHAEALLLTDPLREGFHRLLMQLLARDGQLNAALAQYEKCRRILSAELGIDPAGETTSLYKRLRLARTPPPHQLPVQFTPLVGRRQQLAETSRRLADPECRLLTLTGPGGVGKTRLAISAAEEYRGTFLHGIYFVPLAGVETAVNLPLAIAAALDFSLQARDEPHQQLLAYLRRRELLLVLDNFEQIVEEGADFVQTILQHAPDVKIIITSRERLHLQAEWLLTLGGLAISEVDTTNKKSEALHLFATCAQRVQAGFSLAEPESRSLALQICHLVEGIPLGIELAAASLAIHPLPQVVAQLTENLDFLSSKMRDLPQRHRSLRAAFEHSWQLLSPEEQTAFQRLAVFRGGFDDQAAQAVADASLQALADLASKSLLQPGDENRYSMHEVLRQYAREKLTARSEENRATHERHSAYYTNWLQALDARLQGKEVRLATAVINREADNMLAAWHWAVTHHRLEALRHSAPALSHYYLLRGPFQQGTSLFKMAGTTLENKLKQNNAADPESAAVLAHMLTYQALFLVEQGDYDQAIEVCQQAVEWATTTQDPFALAAGPLYLGRALWRTGDYDSALIQFNLALNRAQSAGLAGIEADGRRALGIIDAEKGNYPAAQQHYRLALELTRKIGDQAGQAKTLNNLSNVLSDMGDYGGAQVHLEQALNIYEQLGSRKGKGNSLNNLGVIYRYLGEHEQAKRYYAQGLDIFRDIGDHWREGLAILNIGNIASDQARLIEARAYTEQARQIFQGINDRFHEGTSLAVLGIIALKGGQYNTATTYFNQAQKIFEETGNRRSKGRTLAYRGLLAHLQEKNKQAELLCRESIELAQELGDRSTKACAQTHLGHALLSERRVEEAAEAYETAVSQRRQLGEKQLYFDSLAGLIRARLAQNRLEDAGRLTAEIQAHLDGHSLDGSDEPLRIYLTCFQVLDTIGDSQAPELLQTAHDLLQKRAAEIPHTRLRQLFLENVDTHREILARVESITGLK